MTSSRIANTVRNLASMFPYAFTNQRHNFERDYGWPEDVGFELLFRAAHRNGIARAAVDKVSLRVWNTMPEVWESEEPRESSLESDIRQRFDDIRFWQACVEADRRAFIGGYSALILRFADSRRFFEPVEYVPGGLKGFVSAEPVWASQLQVSDWYTDEVSSNYGKPKMFELREAGVATDNQASKNAAPKRSYPVHPDRVIVWSADGTVHARSDLEPGFDDLLDMQKIKGAGGEGFWKTSKGMPVIEVDPEARLEDMASMMGVSVTNLKDAIGDEVNEFQLGFNKVLMLAGMKATAVSINLPQPEEFFNAPLRSFAASVSMPTRILLGNETGERATEQDQEDFNRSCMARREWRIRPTLRDFITRLERFAILPERDWTLNWNSLLDAGPDAKMDRAEKMAKINQSAAVEGGRVFEDAEIRAEAGFEELEVQPDEDQD